MSLMRDVEAFQGPGKASPEIQQFLSGLWSLALCIELIEVASIDMLKDEI
jgi:hypothetical protein